MADTKISALTAMTAPAVSDLIPIVDVSDTTMAASGTTKYVTQAILLASPSPIGATTPSTGEFTSLSATGITTVASGTAALPAIVSTTGTADTGLWFPAADTLAASTAGSERIRISSTGIVGIGTSSPQAQLEVAKNLRIGTSGNRNNPTSGNGLELLYSGGNFIIEAYNYSTVSYQPIYISGSKTILGVYGNVGIGTTSPSYLLHVNTDSAGKPGVGGLWTVVSDERIKTDIVPADLDRCYDIVKQVGLKHFGFKPGVYSDEQINDKHSLGWIAQDVQKVFGKAVSIKPFTLQTDIPDGTEEYEEQEFTVETVNKVETSIQVINGKPVQASKTTQVEEKTLLFDEVVVVDVAGDIVMVDGAPLTHKVPRMVTKTRPKVRREVIEDCLDLNGGQMNAALYGAVQCLMSKVEAQAVIIASLQASVAEQAHS